MIRVLLVGDYDKNVIAHDAIPKALALAAVELSIEVAPTWLSTDSIATSASVAAQNPDALWCVPGSPYKKMEGALAAIRFARENKIPFLGTCGGFQHALIEIARNVHGFTAADHAESNPNAAMPLISKLSCSLINQSERLRLEPNTRLREIYGVDKITEPYQCSYGLNPDLKNLLSDKILRFTAHSISDHAVRAFELGGHPFFFGALFQPERSALQGNSHPLIRALLRAAHNSD